MPVALPTSKPRISSEKLHEHLQAFNLDRTKHPLVIVGIRGYYLNTLGEVGKNDRGIYDDALFIDSPFVTASFNANTDPSVFRKGKGKGAEKGIATLRPGLWLSYKFGNHKTYPAIVQQMGEVTVTRDGDPPYEDTGYFGINIHKGSYNSTSSEGCQTIHPDQWQSFIKLAQDQAKRLFPDTWDKVVIPYILLENTGWA
ncbi:MAG: hypothetical protein POELPBGB_01325 [Bacteroidia bacterium]|nr:hypothetical protein [Bacteroidia bacterium]